VRKVIRRGPVDAPAVAHPSGTVKRVFMPRAAQQEREEAA
jgi:hypothetical protein